jgi:hypothetical protein
MVLAAMPKKPKRPGRRFVEAVRSADVRNDLSHGNAVGIENAP